MRLIWAVQLTIALLTVSGCTGVDAQTQSPHTGSPMTPVAVPSLEPFGDSVRAPVVPGMPTPFVDATCSDLLPKSVADKAIDGGIVLRPVAEFRELSWFDEPMGAAMRQLGGFTCEWSNGVRQANDEPNDLYRGIYVSVLPNAATEWPSYADYVDGNGVESYCDAGFAGMSCYYDALIGTTWVHVELVGAASSHPKVAQDSVVASVVGALERARPNESWSAPSGSLAVSLNCNALQPTLDTAFGSTASTDADWGGGWSQEASSWEMAGILGQRCYWYYGEDDGSSWASLTGYAGSAWAWEEVLQSGLVGSPSRFTTPSMRDDDAAWISCPEAGRCILDVVVGHAWLRADIGFQASRGAMIGDRVMRTFAEQLTAMIRH